MKKSEEKEQAMLAAKVKFDGKQKEHSDFKQKVDQQKAKTDSLLQQYLQALPK